MKTFKLIKTFLVAFVLLAINMGCVHDDDYSNPPVQCSDFTNTITIADLKAYYTGSTVQITEDLTLEGYVSSSDETGNIYKYIYIQDSPTDPTQGLTISVDATDTYLKFPVGSKIFIKVKDLYLGTYGGVLQLGDLGVDENGASEFGRISETKYTQKFYKSCGAINTITPKVLTISELSSNDDLIGALVQIDDVEFVSGVLGTTYATYQTTVNKNIEDCSGNTVLLRNSGYSNFYNQLLPEGKGSIVAIMSKYNSDYQLYIRDTDDTSGMSNTKRCYIFNDAFADLSNWTAVSVLGAQYWGITTSYGNPKPCALMNGYSGGAVANEDWLVSKEISLEGYTGCYFSFDTWKNYSGNALQVFVTTNYTGSPTTTSWTQINATVATTNGGSVFTNSGIQSLSAYDGQKIRIAFKYTSTSSAASSWELDNVVVKGN